MAMIATALSPPPGFATVQQEIARACRDASRDPAEVTLVAVSKTFPPEQIEPVIAAGQRVFGESRVQEAKAKWPALQAKHAGIELHLIGPLQSNKAKEAVALFDAIHSVDRPSLAEALAKQLGVPLDLMVAPNTGELVDALEAEGIAAFGPSVAAAMLGWRFGPRHSPAAIDGGHRRR